MLAATPSRHLHARDDWRGFNAQSYHSVEVFDFKIRRRGGFSLPHLRRTKLTRRAGQVCRLFLSPKKSTCAAGVPFTTCCCVLGPGHGVERSTLTTLTRRGNPLRRLSCLLYYCSVCCLPPASCRPEQDTPILTLPLRRCRRCTRIAFGCAQDITVNDGRFYCLSSTTSSLVTLSGVSIPSCVELITVKEKRD